MIMFNNNNIFFISHNKFIKNIYNKVKEENNLTSYRISTLLFCVNSENHMKRAKKRSCEEIQIIEEAHNIKNQFNEFVVSIPEDIKNDLLSMNISDTSSVRDFAAKTFQENIFNHKGISGGNDSSECLKCEIKNDYFLIPSNCRFICGDVAEGCRKIPAECKFDILIADPPWWNKYIRRLKSADDKLSYSMMYNEDIAAIPVQNMLSKNCLIAIWCTNAPSNISAVKNIILPKWGIEYKATWYWIKVTTSLEPICDFSSGCKKQPYERIILGSVGNVEDIPEDLMVVSVPSALHSHKPPIIELLKPYVKVERPQTVELFARYLLPDTTSIGYEPLKWQHISLYQAGD